jgi:hypothetical protein
MKVELEGSVACARSPEGKQASMPIPALLGKVQTSAGEHRSAILPHGVRATSSRGPYVVWVHESPPEVYNFRWITNDSPAKFGESAKYQQVRIALPFVLILAVFIPRPDGQLTLAHLNECYFRTRPLESWDDELNFPALLNCSRYRQLEGRPLSWICSLGIKGALYESERDLNTRMRAAFNALHHCLFETAFNWSSDVHEGASYFTLSQGADPRIATIEKWQEATAQDPDFVLDVPWLKSGHTLGQIVDRIFSNLKASKTSFDSADALARIIFNNQPTLEGLLL